MTLLDDCKALVKVWENTLMGPGDDYIRGWHDRREENIAELRAIIARHEPGEWRGPWKCKKCGKLATPSMQDNPNHPDELARHVKFGPCITGCKFTPYERRGGER